jgi:hypothetical protein
MITVILVAIIGNQVFPGHVGWWIVYVIFMALIKTFSAVLSVIKEM